MQQGLNFLCVLWQNKWSSSRFFWVHFELTSYYKERIFLFLKTLSFYWRVKYAGEIENPTAVTVSPNLENLSTKAKKEENSLFIE